MFAVINGVDYRSGDYVVIDAGGQLCVGSVDRVEPEDIYRGVVGLDTGGWFLPNGCMNISSNWKLLRKASKEEINTLPSY